MKIYTEREQIQRKDTYKEGTYMKKKYIQIRNFLQRKNIYGKGKYE